MKAIFKALLIIALFSRCSNIESQKYITSLDTSLYEIFIEYDTSYFDYYEGMSRNVRVGSDMSNKESSLTFYEMFLSDENDRDIIEQVVQWIQNTTQDPKEQIQLAVTLVQNDIVYDHDKLKNLGNWNVYYPMETLIWKKGVCSDQSLLLGKILVYLDYKICFFLFDDNDHMALGIKTNTRGFAESGFEYIETTGVFPIGDVPLSTPEQRLDLMSEEPIMIVPRYNGIKTFQKYKELRQDYTALEEQFGAVYLSSSAQSRKKLIKLNSLSKDISKLKDVYLVSTKYYEEDRIDFDSLKLVEDRVNDAIRAYNSLIDNKEIY